ncbi:MAG TPA: pilus assembly protein TadG-related protein [Anaerolineae bacterium]
MSMQQTKLSAWLRKPLRGLHAFRRGESGQSMVMAALSVMAIMGMAALLLDGGMAYAVRRTTQNAADAAAFAGARKAAWGASDAEVYAAVQEYALARNNAGSFNAYYLPGHEPVGGGTVPAGANGINVVPTTPYQTYLARTMGFDLMTVKASASASFGPISQPSKIQPLARFCDQNTLQQCGFEYGQIYDLWNGGGPGNFGFLSWDGAVNTPYLSSELDPNFVPDYVDPHGQCGQIAIGCWVQGLTGAKASVKGDLKYWQEVGLQNGTPMIVVIWDQSEGQGSHTNYRIAGFAAFIVTDFKLNGQGYINGKFIQWITNAPVDDGAPNYGLSAVHLTN